MGRKRKQQKKTQEPNINKKRKKVCPSSQELSKIQHQNTIFEKNNILENEKSVLEAVFQEEENNSISILPQYNVDHFNTSPANSSPANTSPDNNQLVVVAEIHTESIEENSAITEVDTAVIIPLSGDSLSILAIDPEILSNEYTQKEVSDLSISQQDLECSVDTAVIIPLSGDSLSILTIDPEILSNEYTQKEVPDLSISQQDLECSVQFNQSRCSHLFSGLSSNISRIDASIESGNSVEICQIEGEKNAAQTVNSAHDSTGSVISLVIDKDYLPTQSSSANTSAEPDDLRVNKEGRPKRGRKRKHPEQNRAEKKAKLNKGLKYINDKGVTVEEKFFTEGFDCNCVNKCTEKVPENKRKIIFQNYWKAGSYEARCALLQGYCKEVKKKRCTNTDSTKRSFTRQYTFNRVSVCEKAFLRTLSISQKPVDIALEKARTQQPVTDKRGQKTGGQNKISDAKLQEIINFIKGLPKYRSHYCREKKTSTKYLSVNLNLALVYDLYKEKYPEGVSKSCFKNVFYTKFNLRFKKPQKDTCNRCDVFKVQKQNLTGTELEKIEAEHDAHLNNARILREQMKKDMKKATEDNTVETLTFDLEKTNCLPKLPTNIIYYKRQLNLYNFGIHQASNNQGYFNVWLENEGGRGTQEVGCCLKKFIDNNLRNTTKHLILWADSCGGQNKSIKLVLMLMHILLNHDTLQTITMRFLQPGHTFLPNDSEFGDLECALKTHNRLYTDEDYINIMKKCRRKNKFVVNRFHREDFLSVEPLLKAITNRKKDIVKKKISWQKSFEIKIKKGESFKLYFKSDITLEDAQIVNIAKSNKSQPSQFKDIKMPLLYPNGKNLSTAKIKDLKEMLKFIPSDCKQFYDFLKDNPAADFMDDIEGYGESIDFDILEYEENDD